MVCRGRATARTRGRRATFAPSGVVIARTAGGNRRRRPRPGLDRGRRRGIMARPRGGLLINRGGDMATYIVLVTFTDQGASRVRDTRKRAAAFRAWAQKAGLAVRDVFWTL